MGKKEAMSTTVMNVVAILDAGVDWKRVEALAGGRARMEIVLREAVRRNLISMKNLPDGVREITVIEPHKIGERS